MDNPADTQPPASNPASPSVKRVRRRWRRLFVHPRGQVRLIFVIPVVFLLAVATLLNTLRSTIVDGLHDLQKTMMPPGLVPASDLSHLVQNVLNASIGLTVLSAILIAAIGLFAGHHFYGPLVPLLRMVRGMKEGDFSQRVRLRKGDELGDLADALNELGDALASRGPKQN